MPLIDELERLAQMHASGALSDAEFATAKAALLAEQTPTSTTLSQDSSQHQRQFAQLQRQQALLRIDQDWQVERQQYLRRGRAPTVGDALLVGGIFVVMSVGFVLFSWQVTGAMSGYIVVLVLFGIGVSFYQWSLADQYSSAEADYRERRRKAEEENGRR